MLAESAQLETHEQMEKRLKSLQGMNNGGIQ